MYPESAVEATQLEGGQMQLAYRLAHPVCSRGLEHTPWTSMPPQVPPPQVTPLRQACASPWAHAYMHMHIHIQYICIHTYIYNICICIHICIYAYIRAAGCCTWRYAAVTCAPARVLTIPSG